MFCTQKLAIISTIKKRKFIILCCVFTLLFVQNVSSQQLGGLYRERNAGFTMSMPNGWETIDMKAKYLMITGPNDNGMYANIGFNDEEYWEPLSDYFDVILLHLPRNFSNFRLVNRSNFVKNDGVVGEYITYTFTERSVQFRQRIYVFPNNRKTRFIIITCTAHGTNAEKYDAIFDVSVGTFVW